MDIEDLIAKAHLRNNAPLDDFCGLTPMEMDHLLHDTYTDRSPVRLRPQISGKTLDGIPWLRLTEEFLKIIAREKKIKLTLLGALPRKVLHELYAHRIITDKYIDMGALKLTREIDFPTFEFLHVNARLTNVTRKQKGYLLLTKEGQRLLKPDQRRDLFDLSLRTFTDTFNWAFTSRYEDDPIGQLGWGYSIYLLLRFGDQPRPIQFYSDKYLLAFPELLKHVPRLEHQSPERDLALRYSHRVFERFFKWFGFVDIEENKKEWERRKWVVRRTTVLTETFYSE